MYVYIYREREKEIYTYVFIYVYVDEEKPSRKGYVSLACSLCVLLSVCFMLACVSHPGRDGQLLKIPPEKVGPNPGTLKWVRTLAP